MKNIKFNLLLLITSTNLIAGTLNTFTLPERNACDGMYYNDIQASFPAVDFATLDRLYIPAQHYKFINIGNLPLRSAANPLVISQP